MLSYENSEIKKEKNLEMRNLVKVNWKADSFFKIASSNKRPFQIHDFLVKKKVGFTG